MGPHCHLLAPADAGVQVRDERAAGARIREVVPGVDGDALRGLVGLPVQTLGQDQRVVAKPDARGDLLADAVDARDQRGAIAPFVVLAGRAEARGEGADQCL